MLNDQKENALKDTNASTDSVFTTVDTKLEKDKAKLVSNLKGFIELLALIFSVIVLGMTCIRASLYSLHYNIPFYVVTSFSAVYDLTLRLTLIIAFVVMYYFPFYWLRDFDYSKNSRWYKRIFHLLCIFLYGILMVVLMNSYCKIVLPSFTSLFEQMLGSQISGLYFAEKIFLILFFLLYFSSMVISYVEHLIHGELKSLTPRRWFAYLSTRITVFVLVIVTSVILAFPWLIYFYSAFFPESVTKYETVVVDGVRYAVICESSDGKIIEKCFEEGGKLTIYTDSYQYISEDNNSNLVFSMKEYDKVEVEPKSPHDDDEIE